MNFKLRYPWAEPGRKCKTYFETGEIGEDGLPRLEKQEVEILEYNYERGMDWCHCKWLSDNKEYYYLVKYLEPIYTVDEIMQYADRTIIEEHWIDFNGDERALYLKKFWGEYFRIDECCGSRKMEKIKINS